MEPIKTDAELNQILFMKKLKLTPSQAAQLTGKNTRAVKRIYNAKKLQKKRVPASRVFDCDNYFSSISTL